MPAFGGDTTTGMSAKSHEYKITFITNILEWVPRYTTEGLTCWNTDTGVLDGTETVAVGEDSKANYTEARTLRTVESVVQSLDSWSLLIYQMLPISHQYLTDIK